MRLVFPDGGGLGGLSWRFWIRRPSSPSVTGGGTIGQITVGGNVITIGLDPTEHITVTADDGASDLTDTSAEPLSGFTWTAVAMVVDPTDETLIVYVSGEAVAELDLSGLTFADADSGMSFTVGVEADGSNPLDFDIGNIMVWPGPLTEGEVAAIDGVTGPGPLFDPGNGIVGTSWDGTNEPDLAWIEPIVDNVIPDAGPDGDEPLVVIGDVESIYWDEDDAEDGDVPAYDFGHNFGHPSVMHTSDAPSGTETETLSLGFGDEHVSSAEDYDPPMYSGLALTVVMRSGEFGDDGGSIVQLFAPGGSLPSAGPFRVRLVDADGKLWPPLSEEGCYAARASQGDELLANRSREYLQFTLPVVPLGTYGVRLTWDDERSIVTFGAMIIVVPADTSLETLWLKDSWR